MPEFVNLPILVFSLLITISVLTSVMTLKMGIPVILIFLCIGLTGGYSGLNLFGILKHPDSVFFIGSVALALILFDSGFHTKLKNYRQAYAPAFLMSTLGVLLTAVFLLPVAGSVLQLDPLYLLLLVSIISSTDSASVFCLLRSKGISIREKLKATLELESGSNDPMAIFLTTTCIIWMRQNSISSDSGFTFLMNSFFTQALIGLGLGVLLGIVLKVAVNRIKLETALYPILTVVIALGGFALTNMLGGSGYLAIYLAGLMLGNSKIQAAIQISKFQTTLMWLSQIILFTSLGLFVSWDSLKETIVPGIILGLALMFIARPLMTFLILSFFPSWNWREKTFVSFVGLRGATSILLAIAPIVYNLPNAEYIFDIIFVMVLLSLAVQGFFIPACAKWCSVFIPILEQPPEKTEIDLPGLTDTSLILYELGPNTPALHEDPLPKWARPSLIIRDGISYSPSNIKSLKAGDHICVFAESSNRENLLDRLYGKGEQEEAIDILGDFPLSPQTTFAELSKMYGIPVPQTLLDTTISDLIVQEFEDVEVGDRFSFKTIELVVRALKDGVPTDIGIDIDPSRRRSLYTKTYHILKKHQN